MSFLSSLASVVEFLNEEKSSVLKLVEGTWGGPEYSNTAKKINEHCITARKVYETP